MENEACIADAAAFWALVLQPTAPALIYHGGLIRYLSGKRVSASMATPLSRGVAYEVLLETMPDRFREVNSELLAANIIEIQSTITRLIDYAIACRINSWH